MLQKNPEARQYTYAEIANHFKYDRFNKVFTPRSKKVASYFVNYAFGLADLEMDWEVLDDGLRHFAILP